MQEQLPQYLKQLKQENTEVKKKLLMFRSGLEKLMNKKPTTKRQGLSRHQVPSHDDTVIKQYASSINQQQQQQQYNNAQKQHNKQTFSYNNNSSQQPQFGFNSTLFRQITDQTVMSNTSSGVFNSGGKQFGASGGVNYYQDRGVGMSRDSSNGLLQQKTGSNIVFDNKDDKNINIPIVNNYNYKQEQQQPFKKSSLLFNQIDQLMNKANKSTKLPIKPIQKYINQKQQQQLFQQSKLITDRDRQDSMEIQLTLSSSRLAMGENYSNTMDKGRGSNNNNNINSKQLGDTNKQPHANRSSSSSLRKDKLLLTQTNDFLKSMRQKASSLIIQGSKPPLPQQAPIQKLNTKFTEQQLMQQQKYGQQQQLNNIRNTQELEEVKSQVEQSRVIKKQRITTKIKQTLSERKKLIKQQMNKHNMMDQTIQLELSSDGEQQQKQRKSDIEVGVANEDEDENENDSKNHNVEQKQISQRQFVVNNNQSEQHISQLKQQRIKLLQQLSHIENELQLLQQFDK